MTTWFKYFDTPPLGGAMFIGIWYRHPPTGDDGIAQEVHIFELIRSRRPGENNWVPPLQVKQYRKGRWFIEDAPRYWTPLNPPEENECP